MPPLRPGVERKLSALKLRDHFAVLLCQEPLQHLRLDFRFPGCGKVLVARTSFVDDLTCQVDHSIEKRVRRPTVLSLDMICRASDVNVGVEAKVHATVRLPGIQAVERSRLDSLNLRNWQQVLAVYL